MKRKTYTGIISNLPNNGVFVFGSNTQGRHGKGSAKIALDKFGAKYGQSSGLQGRSYALVTKNLQVRHHPSISREDIVFHIRLLYNYSYKNPDKDFYIAYSSTGTNLNGYTPEEMASMFITASQKAGYIPENIIFEEGFCKIIESDFKKKYDL